MATIEFKHETLYTETYEKYGDFVQVIANVKSTVEKSGYYKGCTEVVSIALTVLDSSGKDITKEIYSLCSREAKLMEMDAEEIFTGRVERGH
jgi:hypothetical protein